MTLLEYCKAIPGWGDCLEIEKGESGEIDIFAKLYQIVDYYGGYQTYETDEEARLKELAFNYFDAVMSNMLPFEYYDPMVKFDEEVLGYMEYWIRPNNLDLLLNYKIIIDQEVREYCSTARTPHYRLRGKQLERMDYSNRCGFSDTEHLRNLADDKGNINRNTMSSYKFAKIYELISDAIKIIQIYKNVDIMIALADRNIVPDNAQKIWTNEKCKEQKYSKQDKYTGFIEHIELGIWIHDQTIEFMEPSRAKEKYVEYDKLFSGE